MRVMGNDRGQAVGRLIGLGRPPTEPGVLAGVGNQSFSQVPVIEYVTWTTELPMSNANAAATFPIGNRGVDILATDAPVPGIDSVDTSFVRNGILQTDMYVIGFGAHIFAEPFTFTQIGNVLTPAPGASFNTPVSPDVMTVNDGSGVSGGSANNPLGLTAGQTLLPALLKWGHDAWMATWHFANGFQFVWRFNQRQILIQELVADVCYFGPYADAVASGTSEADVQEYARRSNDRTRAVGGTGIFVPVNSRRIGSVTAPLAGVGNCGVFHPTRDFDLAPVTYGGVRNQGATGSANPFRKLPCPTLLSKGIPIGMQLIAQDNTHYREFLRHVELSDFGAAATLNTTAYDAFDSGTSAASARSMIELTFDQGPSTFSPQTVTTSRVEQKGGTIKFAILIKGYEAWGPWIPYLKADVDRVNEALAASHG